MNLFHSARLKLTGFYFAVLVVFCALLTFGVHAFTTHELQRADDARRGAVHNLVQQYLNDDNSNNNGETGSGNASYNPPPQPAGDRIFANTQRRQSDVTNAHLDHDFLLLDVCLLLVGAVLSYWYAGRTLRPIEEAHEQQKRFTADASHELRTPLTSMKLENELFLRQKGFSEHEARDLIGSNLEEVARLERLATNLLALNNYEHGSIAKQPSNMSDIIQEAVTTMRERPDMAATFKVKAAKDTQLVDHESLVELLVILLDNAVKYGPPKGPVEITGKKEGSQYIVTIRDHGPGILAEDMPYIFDRMYRADKARTSKVSGHGIGLSLARQIATANNAALTADNHQQGGAVFMLRLG